MSWCPEVYQCRDYFSVLLNEQAHAHQRGVVSLLLQVSGDDGVLRPGVGDTTPFPRGWDSPTPLRLPCEAS